MDTTDKPWDGSASRFKDAGEFCDACLVNENTGDREEWVKSKCHLPVREPGGQVNKNGVHAAASRLMQTKISPELKKKAAAKLRGLYRQLQEAIPDSLKQM